MGTMCDNIATQMAKKREQFAAVKFIMERELHRDARVNAADDEGLDVPTRISTVAVRTEQTESYVEISVVDNGGGFYHGAGVL